MNFKKLAFPGVFGQKGKPQQNITKTGQLCQHWLVDGGDVVFYNAIKDNKSGKNKKYWIDWRETNNGRSAADL